MRKPIFNTNDFDYTKEHQEIEKAIEILKHDANATENELADVLENIRLAIVAGRDFIVPMEEYDEATEEFVIRAVQMNENTVCYGAFSNKEEILKGEETDTALYNIEKFFEDVLMDKYVDGVLLNPWGDSLFIPKEFIELIFKENLPIGMENMICIDAVDEEHVFCDLKVIDAEIKLGSIETARDFLWDTLEKARLGGMHSIAFMDFEGGKEDDLMQVILRTISDWTKVNYNHGTGIVLVCKDKGTAAKYCDFYDEKFEDWGQRSLTYENDGRLEKAIQFAMEAHKGDVRKGTTMPYILHPLETLQILTAMGADMDLLIAGVLHDTLEDTGVTSRDILEEFGVEVATLVNGHTEDKRQVWYMRKLKTVTDLPNEETRLKMLAIADKVANMRSMYRDYREIGDDLWKRFNAPMHMQAWYYSKLGDGFEELQNYDNTRDIYWEMVGLYKDLFVLHFVDEDNGMMYQLSADGDDYMLKRGQNMWVPMEGDLPETAKRTSRHYAERICDNWAEEECVEESGFVN